MKTYEKKKFNDVINKNIEQCFQNISSEVNMNEFIHNLQGLKEELAFNPKTIQFLKSDPSIKQNQKLFKPKESPKSTKSQNKAKNTKRELPRQDSRKSLEKKLGVLENDLQQKIKRERSKNKRTLKEEEFNSFYERGLKYQQKSVEKQIVIKSQRDIDQSKELTFQPSINEKSKKRKLSTNHFLQQNQEKFKQKMSKLEMIQKKMTEEENEKFQQNCTFKPSINKSREIKRNLSNLMQWEDQVKVKKELIQSKAEEQFKQQCTFKPKINQYKHSNSQNIIKDTSQRLYQQSYRKINPEVEKLEVKSVVSISKRSVSKPRSSPQKDFIKLNQQLTQKPK